MTSSLQVRGSRRVVIVVAADRPITGAGIAAQLRQQGFDVAAVVTAVEMLDATGNMVVCDLRLPGRSGPDAVAFLAQRGCRVLATSGVARQEEIMDVVAAGARRLSQDCPDLGVHAGYPRRDELLLLCLCRAGAPDPG